MRFQSSFSCGKVADNDRICIGVADTCTECQTIVALCYQPQVIEMRQENDRSDLAHELRYPKADIGRARNNRGTRIAFQHVREIIDIDGKYKLLSALPENDALAIFQGKQLFGNACTLSD